MKTELSAAINTLTKELSKDKSKGSYYHSWQCNIAMAFTDACNEFANKESLPAISNVAAKNFLDRLIYTNKSEENENV